MGFGALEFASETKTPRIKDAPDRESRAEQTYDGPAQINLLIALSK
jgi:hypothetical protein